MSSHRLQHGMLACLLTCCGFLACGCGDGVKRSAVKADPETASVEAMKLYDANSDGTIDAGELKNSPALEMALPRVDTDGNAQISAEEIAARIRRYDELSSHMACEVQVIRNRRAVAGADVTFAPEAFMGSGFPTYQGKTNDQGAVNLLTTPPTPGVAVGFYRVTIKPTDGEEVTRGVEIADDVPSGYRIEFTL